MGLIWFWFDGGLKVVALLVVYFYFFLSVLVPEVEGERQKGKERERNSKKIIKKNIKIIWEKNKVLG